jgi:TatA/E family protein of Tat protein translocase
VFGGHLPELVILLVVALVIFGPKRLPEIGGAMGKGIREFRKGTTEIEEQPNQIAASQSTVASTVAQPASQPAPEPSTPAPQQPVETAATAQDPNASPKA